MLEFYRTLGKDNADNNTAAIHKAREIQTLLSIVYIVDYNGKGKDICIAPHSQKLATEALRYGSHSFYTANTPYLPLPRKFARRRHY